ncbi:hypothetical protein [Acidimangrovimonas sediminis]|uniref:hypothetical protein n=1 Tax=Acidimangrovimonas sediminis TaxID=2056283 RepID=UPI000C7FBB34|nr:hypothetical protein [Acidimangrovimonas sediminis]
MFRTARQTALATEGLALAGILSALGAIGLGSRAAGAALALGLFAVACYLGALGALRHLAHLQEVAPGEFPRSLTISIVAGLAFVGAIYHLPGLMPLFGDVHVAIDHLVPLWVDHVLALAPGVALLLLAAWLRRQQPGTWAMQEGGHLKISRPRGAARAGRKLKKSKGGLNG